MQTCKELEDAIHSGRIDLSTLLDQLEARLGSIIEASVLANKQTE